MCCCCLRGSRRPELPPAAFVGDFTGSSDSFRDVCSRPPSIRVRSATERGRRHRPLPERDAEKLRAITLLFFIVIQKTALKVRSEQATVTQNTSSIAAKYLMGHFTSALCTWAKAAASNRVSEPHHNVPTVLPCTRSLLLAPCQLKHT